MRRFKIFLILLVSAISHSVAQDSIRYRLILAGDAGKLNDGKQPELDLIHALFNLNDKKTSIVYLGDNIYPQGLPSADASNFAEKKRILDSQVELVKNTSTNAYFVPGNHDWMQGRKDGFEQILHQGRYIDSLALPNVFFIPKNGCPGPVEIPLGDQIVMVVVDTQWWLHKGDKPGITSDCDCRTKDELVLQLKDVLYKNRNKLVIFAAHHPFKTYGEHGGHFTFKQHLFPLTELNKNLYIPLPVIGSIYPLSRKWFGNIQDTKHPEYRDLINRIDTVLSTHPYCIRVSGHEHALEWIVQKGQNYIVSGAGSKETAVKYGAGSRFADDGRGFAAIEVLNNGGVRLKFYSSQSSNPGHLLYADSLKTFVAPEKTSEKFSSLNLPDSIVREGVQYYKAGSFKQFAFGSNYRNEWTTPIKVKVFDIGKEMGGLTPIKRGGGFQSKSLRLEDSTGKQYVLRSIEKFPDRVLPEVLRETFVKDFVVDGVSASYPYAALSIPVLATAADIPHANPSVVYIPDDPRFRQYRADFANGLFIFEEREPGGFKKTYSSPDVFEEMQKDNDNRVDQKAVLKARVLDMFIMDFDRHEDQWRWANIDKDKGEKKFIPIPRDRDQPFFINTGLLPAYLSKPWLLPAFQGFRPHAKNINTFNFNCRYFDRSFLTNLSEKDWHDAVQRFLPLMTDTIITQALYQQPKEIQQYRLQWIISTLKERRKYLEQDMIRYYKFLAKEVDVVGSDKKELFEINRTDSGTVSVVMYKINKEGEKSDKLFERNFLSTETKEIRLWGMGGEDKFVINGSGRSKTVKVRIIGGAGKDSFENSAENVPASKTVVYDQSSEENQISGSGNIRNKISSDPDVNRFDRKAYKYNLLVPFLYGAYNPDDGVFLGFSLKNTRRGFRKDPYKIVHQFRASYAIATGAYNFRYDLDAIDAIGKLDLVLKTNFDAPDYTQNYFGKGNETVFDKSAGKKIIYYRSRFNLIQGSLSLRANPAENFSISTGPIFQRYWIDKEDNIGKFISDPNSSGLNPDTLFSSKSYLGWQVEKEVDNRNSKMLPSRGVYWKTYLRAAKGLDKYARDIAQLGTDLSFYLSFNIPADIVIAARLGGGINFGKYEFFQAQYLSGLDNLRGYRKYRFAGDKMVFNNIDLRIKLADFRGYLLPGSFGLVAFHDVGRVWVKGESSSVWHNGYGGGLWIAPAGRFVIAACYGASKDGGLPFVSFGFQF